MSPAMLTNTFESESLPVHRGEPQDAKPVDLTHLRRYTMGDVDLEKEVLDLFLGQLPLTIQALSEATTERDWMVAAHTLKGSGRAVGAWHVARLAEHAERQLLVHKPALKAEAVAHLRDAAEEARAYIRSAYPRD
jgi:HPt (histidine-containing phosphotransfer) domain-containing protein